MISTRGNEMTEQQTAPNPQERAADPPAGTPVIVNVVARTKPDGRVEFSHTWKWNDGTPGGNGTIRIPQRDENAPGTAMQFHLIDETRPPKNLDFTDDSEGAMWVKRDSCPPEHERCEDPQIPASEMRRTPNLLQAFNKNSEQCTLHYRLRFKDRAGNAHSYDPDITNGGTSRL
jgi:hypothetical protein